MHNDTIPNDARLFVIHGHFYQPPRENPWLSLIERQPSAKPAHDWNERVFDECYRPNAFSRLLDPHGMIRGIHNNYRNLSFNFGPTLFRWLLDAHPEVAERVVQGDRESVMRLGGHGNAIAQVYNHIIMPLASRRDQLTQIRWAKSFFRRHFQREPEGIWLAETAINADTVRCLIEEDIRFTVLSPNQAEAIRPLDQTRPWASTSGVAVDTRRAYRVFVGGGPNDFLDVFFFDEGLSKAISFGDLLTNAANLTAAVAGAFDKHPTESQAVVVATDGETFGHHKAYGDMCLAYMFTTSAPAQQLAPVNFGYLLERFPPRYEVRLKNADGEGTAWSCAHGVGRWCRDCGCQTGGQSNWNQKWRGPLREALTGAQKHVDAVFERDLGALFADPWAVRDMFEQIVDTRSLDDTASFLQGCGAKALLSNEDVTRTRRLLQAQKYQLFSYTSCGWFFSDVAGIETIQNLAYAGRAIQNGVGDDARDAVLREFLDALDKACGNGGGQTGKTLFEAHVRPFLAHLQIAAFTAAADKALGREVDLYEIRKDYDVHSEHVWHRRIGRHDHDVFRVLIRNDVEGESADLSVLISHKQGVDMVGWVLPTAITRARAFDRSKPDSWESHPQAIRLGYSALFASTREKLSEYFFRRISQRTLEHYTSWLGENCEVLDTMVVLSNSLPLSLYGPLQFVLNAQWNAEIARIEELVRNGDPLTLLLEIWQKAVRFGVKIDLSESSAALERALVNKLSKLTTTIDETTCDRMTSLLNIVDRFAVPVRKHVLEDAFYPVFTVRVHALYDEYRTYRDASPQNKALLLRLLTFSRRMNFATDAFPVT